MHTGSCLCGAVTVEVSGDLPGPDACHCAQCRKWTGHLLASTDVPREHLVVHGQDNVSWFQSSDRARRGFCKTCGSSLFFDPLDRTKHNWTAVAMGVFRSPTNTKLRLHIHTASKGDYYDIADDVPKKSD